MPPERSTISIPMPGFGLMLLLTLVVIGGWALLFESRPPIPITADELSRVDPVTRIQAIEALVRRGKDGVSELVQAVEGDHRRSRVSAIIGLGQIGPDASEAINSVRAALDDDEPEVCSAAITAYWNISQDAKSAIPVIIRKLSHSNDEVRANAMSTLENIGRIHQQPFIELMMNDSSDIHAPAWRIVRQAWYENVDPLLVKRIRGLLENSNPEIRQQALLSLVTWKIASVPEIRELLHSEESAGGLIAPDPHPEMNPVDASLIAIAKLGAESKELIPEIIAILERLDYLGLISMSGTEVAPDRMTNLMINPRLELILNALSSMKEASHPAIPVLTRKLEEMQPQGRILIARTLIDIGCDPGVVIPELVSLFTNVPDNFNLLLRTSRWSGESISHEAGRQLFRASPEESRRQARLLIPKLGEDEAGIDKSEFFLLASLGPAASEAVPVLTALIHRTRSDVRGAAIFVLTAIGPDAAPAVPTLVSLLRDHSREPDRHASINESVLEALAKIGPSAKDAIPVLLKIIQNPQSFEPRTSFPLTLESRLEADEQIQLMAISTLGKIGEGNSTAIESLRSLLVHTSSHVRVVAVQALGDAGKRSERVLADFIPLLQDENESVRLQAAMSISSLEGNRKSAIIPLEEVLADRSLRVRAAAVIALGSFGPDAKSSLAAIKSLDCASDEPISKRLQSRFGWTLTRPWYDPTPQFERLSLKQIVINALASIDPPVQ